MTVYPEKPFSKQGSGVARSCALGAGNGGQSVTESDAMCTHG